MKNHNNIITTEKKKTLIIMKGTKIIRIDGYIGMYRPSADDHCIPNILPLYIYIY